MRGRKPKPTKLAALHGHTSHGRKANPHEPMPVDTLAEPPDWLSDAQKDGWRYVLAHAPPGLLGRIDKGALAVWVVAEDLHRQATMMQNKVNLLWRPPNATQPQQSPYLPIINRQGLIMLKAASELGFSPTSRPRAYGGVTEQPLVAPLTGAAPVTRVVSLDDYLADTPPPPTTH